MKRRLRGFNRFRRALWLVLALLLPSLAEAQRPGPGGQPGRRQELQQQIGKRFMEHVSTQLRLDDPTRNRLEQHLRSSGQERQQLARRAAQLRAQMMRAARDSATTDDEFRRLLGEAVSLRQREEDLWKTDQQALAQILNPRQQVQFVFMWMRFNEQIRQLANQRSPGGPPPFRP